MAIAKQEESKEEESKSSENKWAKWKRGGIIGAAAITGGALMAITGGMDPSKSLLLILQSFKFLLETIFSWFNGFDILSPISIQQD